MPFRFRRTIRIAPGLRINLGKRGASLSVGGKGLTVNVSERGTRTTVGIPGTGISYSEGQSFDTSSSQAAPKVWPLVVLIVGVGAVLALVLQ